MMKFRIRGAITDIYYIFLHRMKLIWKDRITVGVFFISAAIFALLIRSLSISAEDMSTLPVGVVDYDNSNNSKQLVLGLQKVETLRIVVEDEMELQKLLQDEMITSIFVIEKGYEEKLKVGNLKEIISMYYKKDNKAVSILSDIVAGEMLYPICFYKGLRYYEKIPFKETKLTATAYERYMVNLVGSSGDFDFAFHLIYETPEKMVNVGRKVSNSVLYNQFIIGILGILVAFIAMFLLSGTVKEKEIGVEVRLHISRFQLLKRDTGNLLALFVTEGFFAILFTGIIFGQLKSRDGGLWISAYSLLLLNAFVLGAVLLLIAKIIKKMHIYQVVSSVLILLTGGFGFYYLLTGFYQGYADNMVKIIPNSWFIQGFTDIIGYNSEGGYFTKGHKVLLFMAALLILVVAIIDIIQEFHSNKFCRNNKNRMVN
jgi:ABC-2 type transport system permease protein